MSIKLYQGYRAAGVAVDEDRLCAAARPLMDPMRDRLDAIVLAETAASAIDKANASGAAPPPCPLDAAADAYRADQDQMDSRTVWQDPHRAALWIGRDPLSGDLAILLQGHRQYNEAMNQLPSTRPYGYWDNSDRPDDVSKAEWAERREFWQRVFVTGRYSDLTVRWNLRAGPDDGLDRLVAERVDLVAASVPSRRERAAAIVRDAVLLESAEPSWDITRFSHCIFQVADLIADGVLDDLMTAADELLVDISGDVLTGTTSAALPDGRQRNEFARRLPAAVQGARAACQ